MWVQNAPELVESQGSDEERCWSFSDRGGSPSSPPGADAGRCLCPTVGFLPSVSRALGHRLASSRPAERRVPALPPGPRCPWKRQVQPGVCLGRGPQHLLMLNTKPLLPAEGWFCPWAGGQRQLRRAGMWLFRNWLLWGGERPGTPLVLRGSHTQPLAALRGPLSKDSLTQEAGPGFPPACSIKHWNFLVFPVLRCSQTKISTNAS